MPTVPTRRNTSILCGRFALGFGGRFTGLRGGERGEGAKATIFSWFAPLSWRGAPFSPPPVEARWCPLAFLHWLLSYCQPPIFCCRKRGELGRAGFWHWR